MSVTPSQTYVFLNFLCIRDCFAKVDKFFSPRFPHFFKNHFPYFFSPFSVLIKKGQYHYFPFLETFNTLRAGVWYCVPRFQPKTSSFRLPFQRPSSSADCARELFNGSNGSASFLVCTRKKNFWLGVWIFCEWRHKWSSFGVILAHVAWPRAQPLGQSLLLKYLLVARLESESFEPLIDFLALLGQKLWSKINKLINYLISWLVKYFYYFRS